MQFDLAETNVDVRYGAPLLSSLKKLKMNPYRRTRNKNWHFNNIGLRGPVRPVIYLAYMQRTSFPGNGPPTRVLLPGSVVVGVICMASRRMREKFRRNSRSTLVPHAPHIYRNSSDVTVSYMCGEHRPLHDIVCTMQ